LAFSAIATHAQPTSGTVNPVAGAVAATGAISGRVLNVATGQYLANAQVKIKETNQTANTDKFGGYVIAGVPEGPVTLEVFYTGLDAASLAVIVPAGGTAAQDVSLSNAARYGKEQEAVKLDPFVIASNRETNAQAIAVNEQRFSPNLKNVSSTDILGGILGNSIGEFLKSMPGVTAEYDTMDVSGFNLRGMGSNKTAVNVDGIPAANVFVIGPTRAVDMRSMSLNDISRIEVSKVPTPSMPADSLAGSVNMIRKNSFERTGRVLRYNLSFATTNEDLRLGDSPSNYRDAKRSTLRPGGGIDFTLPVTKNFGLVLSALAGNTMGHQHFANTIWANSGTGTNANAASISNPLLSGFQLMDGNRYMYRNGLSFKTDWRIGDHSVLSFGLGRNTAVTEIGVSTIQFNTGTNGTPTITAGTPLTFDAANTRGATGQGSITKVGRAQELDQATGSMNANYTYDDGRWKIDGGFGLSSSTASRQYESIGSFFNSNSVSRDPLRVNFLGIGPDRPSTIEVFDNSNQSYDWLTLNNFRPTTSDSATTNNAGATYTTYLNLKRRLNFFTFPAAIQIGGMHRRQVFENRQQNPIWDFQGPDGSSPTSAASPFANQVYVGMDNRFGFRNIVFQSPYRTYQAYAQNSKLFSQSPARLVSNESFRITNSEHFEEKVPAGYVQGEADFFDSRLKVLGGVRFEKTTSLGEGSLSDPTAVYQRDSAGRFILDATNKPVRKPEAGAAGSMQELNLILRERALSASRTYSGSYPSLHLTYKVQENLQIRAAYASTYGRPDVSDVIPRTVVSQPNIDTPNPLGNLTVRNPTLKPWSSDNYDLSVEYYTKAGGVLSAGVFRKQIQDFFASRTQVATSALLNQMGLSQDYLGWTINTRFNSGGARIDGFEVDLRQSLRELGGWGRYFTVFGNATKLNLQSSVSGAFATDYSAQGGGSYIPESANWGTTFENKRATVTLRWNYRGLQQLAPLPAFGPDGFQYLKLGTTLDVSAAYRLNRRLSFNLNAVNVNQTPQVLMNYGSATPVYARQFRTFRFGVQLSAGITGTF